MMLRHERDVKDVLGESYQYLQLNADQGIQARRKRTYKEVLGGDETQEDGKNEVESMLERKRVLLERDDVVQYHSSVNQYADGIKVVKQKYKDSDVDQVLFIL